MWNSPTMLVFSQGLYVLQFYFGFLAAAFKYFLCDILSRVYNCYQPEGESNTNSTASIGMKMLFVFFAVIKSNANALKC